MRVHFRHKTYTLLLALFVTAFFAVSFGPAYAQPTQDAASVTLPSPGAVPASASQPTPLTIARLADGSGAAPSKLEVGLGDDLAVVISASGPVDASRFVLFLNGHEIDGLDGTNYSAKLKALVFHLQRNDKNASTWKALLGGPTGLTVPANVALGERLTNNQSATPTITGDNGSEPTFSLVVLSPWRLLCAVVIVLSMLVLVWGSASRTAILKDNLIPQIDPKRQTYSLGRWQMAVWFTLVFASYVFLYIVLDDVNTLSNQALMLMGISGTTALAAAAVDAAKDTPADSVNAGLRLLGINSYADVVRINAEIDDRSKRLASNPPPSPTAIVQLNSEILDRRLLLRNYEDAIAGFVSQGWFTDIVTDLNGTALHRLQIVCWTALLGLIFLVGVWQDLAMPQFSNTLLALMAISGAGYVGFKYPESQQ